MLSSAPLGMAAWLLLPSRQLWGEGLLSLHAKLPSWGTAQLQQLQRLRSIRKKGCTWIRPRKTRIHGYIIAASCTFVVFTKIFHCLRSHSSSVLCSDLLFSTGKINPESSKVREGGSRLAKHPSAHPIPSASLQGDEACPALPIPGQGCSWDQAGFGCCHPP